MRAWIVGTALSAIAGILAEPAAAQDVSSPSRRVALDSVIGWQDYFRESADWPAQVVVDGFTTAEIRPGWQAAFRPKVWRVRGEWELLVDQVSIQTEFHKGSNWRLEVGRFPSPIGLGMTENRPDLNGGMIWWHRPYYMPLPSLGPGLPRVSLVSAVYPTGAAVTASGTHWDARAAVVDRPPVQFWRRPANSPLEPNVIVGAGVSPRQGLRIGVAAATGVFAKTAIDNASHRYTMTNVEGEYAFDYTKVSGEWTRDVFGTPYGDRVSTGWTLQVQQTVTPRLFVHSRLSVLDSPQTSPANPLATTLAHYRAMDTSLGVRITPTLTVRLGHTAMRSFSADDTDQEFGMSLMWATRWW